MIDYHELIPLPPAANMNTGLSPAHQFTMLGLLGVPGRLTRDCSPLTNARLRSQMVTHKFNNFSVTGWEPAVAALNAVMTDIYEHDRDLHAVIRTAGMLCNRAVRGSTTSYSDHSWGTAGDFQIGSQLDPMGAHQCQRGILMAYPYFHKQGFYWGAEFPRPDAMHMELADETVRRLYKQYYG